VRVAPPHPHARLDMFPFVPVVWREGPPITCLETAVAALIRTKGITRCPTTCAFPWLRERRIAARRRMFGSFRLVVPGTE
jgi:hypothetical protein